VFDLKFVLKKKEVYLDTLTSKGRFEIKDSQKVNHYEGIEALTAKDGLTKSMRNPPRDYLETGHMPIDQYFSKSYVIYRNDFNKKTTPKDLKAWQQEYRIVFAESLLKKFEG